MQYVILHASRFLCLKWGQAVLIAQSQFIFLPTGGQTKACFSWCQGSIRFSMYCQYLLLGNYCCVTRSAWWVNFCNTHQTLLLEFTLAGLHFLPHPIFINISLINSTFFIKRYDRKISLNGNVQGMLTN